MDGLADRIRRAMDAAEGTAVEQARRCGFKTPTQLHNTVARLSERPDAVELATLRKIAGGLGVSFDWLVTGRDELAERALRAPRFSDLPNWQELLAEAQESTTAAPWRGPSLCRTAPSCCRSPRRGSGAGSAQKQRRGLTLKSEQPIHG